MEEILFAYLKKNKTKAWEYIYRKYYKKVYGICCKLLLNKNEIEDTVQEVFIKVFENIKKFKFKSKLETWIYRIAINHILNKNKKLNFFLEFDEAYLSAEMPLSIEYKELEKEISNALNRLKKDEKEIFILREIEGFSYKEIAKVMSIKEGTVKSKIHYVRKKLRNLLEFYMKD